MLVALLSPRRHPVPPSLVCLRHPSLVRVLVTGRLVTNTPTSKPHKHGISIDEPWRTCQLHCNQIQYTACRFT
jgi:hypothetical protein